AEAKGLRQNPEVSCGIEEGQASGHEIPQAPGLGTVDRAADWDLFRAYGLLRAAKRELSDGSVPDAIRGRLLVHRVDVAAARALLRTVAWRREPHQAFPSWGLAGLLQAAGCFEAVNELITLLLPKATELMPTY